jgi:hypothetical protein
MLQKLLIFTKILIQPDTRYNTLMLSTLDILYLTLALCSLVVTVMLVLVGSELLRILRDARSIAYNIEQISHLVHRVAGIVVPGVERAAHKADQTVSDVHDTVSTLIRRFSRNSRSTRRK